jgi:hypothetical protein
MKILLDSDRTILSQNKFVATNQGKTLIDRDFLNSFEYSEISKMSLGQETVDLQLLKKQLEVLYHTNVEKQWLLKTHLYTKFEFPVIDIITDKFSLPFSVKATVSKITNPAVMQDYHPFNQKIPDSEVLYKFYCFNLAKDRINFSNNFESIIALENIYSGWTIFVDTLESLNFCVSTNQKNYYEQWLNHNEQYKPSALYQKLIQEDNFDYDCTDLCIEERYCMLALSRKKFKILK